MGVNLKYRRNIDGSVTPVIDVYHKGDRTYEFMWFLKLLPELSKHDKLANKERMVIVKSIQAYIALYLTCLDYDIEFKGLKYKPKIKVAFPDFPKELVERYPELASFHLLLNRIKSKLKNNDNRRNKLSGHEKSIKRKPTWVTNQQAETFNS